MSFDALLTLLLVIFFVLGPLIRRLQGGQQQPPGPPNDRRPGNRQAPQASPPPNQSEPVDEALARRIEEARRRVQEAMAETGSKRGEASRPRPTGDSSQPQTLDWQEVYRSPENRPALDWQQVSGPADRGSDAGQRQQSTGTLDWQQVRRPVETFIQPQQAAARKVDPARTGAPGGRSAARARNVGSEQRLETSRTARLSAERLPALHRDGILQGIVWHEILGEPVAKRGTRRIRSRPRSR